MSQFFKQNRPKSNKVPCTTRILYDQVKLEGCKKKILEFMQEEWNTMPKDVNRNQYLKRINGLIKDLKG